MLDSEALPSSVTPLQSSDTKAEPTKTAAPFTIRLHHRRRSQVSPAKLWGMRGFLVCFGAADDAWHPWQVFWRCLSPPIKKRRHLIWLQACRPFRRGRGRDWQEGIQRYLSLQERPASFFCNGFVEARGGAGDGAAALIIANAHQQAFVAGRRAAASPAIRKNKPNRAFNCCLCKCLFGFRWRRRWSNVKWHNEGGGIPQYILTVLVSEAFGVNTNSMHRHNSGMWTEVQNFYTFRLTYTCTLSQWRKSNKC